MIGWKFLRCVFADRSVEEEKVFFKFVWCSCESLKVGIICDKRWEFTESSFWWNSRRDEVEANRKAASDACDSERFPVVVVAVVVGALHDKLCVKIERKTRRCSAINLIKSSKQAHTRRWWKMNWSELNREVVVNFYLVADKIAPIYAMKVWGDLSDKRRWIFRWRYWWVHSLILHDDKRCARVFMRENRGQTNLEWIKLYNYQLKESSIDTSFFIMKFRKYWSRVIWANYLIQFVCAHGKENCASLDFVSLFLKLMSDVLENIKEISIKLPSCGFFGSSPSSSSVSRELKSFRRKAIPRNFSFWRENYMAR